MNNEKASEPCVPLEPDIVQPRLSLGQINENRCRISSCELGTEISKPKSDQFNELEKSKESGSQDLIKQIRELRNEITEMNKRVVDTEEDLKIKDSETAELKELLMKIKDDHEVLLESCEEQSSCKGCQVS